MLGPCRARPARRSPGPEEGTSLRREETAERTLVEDERRVRVGVVVEVDDAAHDEEVVAELDLVLDDAVDPRPDAPDDRAPGRGVGPGHVVEAVVADAALGEPPTQPLLA